ncbi:hypothetical protein ABL78_3291 [Leptomonas seymouri]|uniref:FHA domain-containing protein n=1 Tax=Leptomonas seymouri TaxID=5684 RepID=A0A0N1I4Z7_LEPSE|nr:hypothetical protein ABL78_3291 [Leptomonas seymouri]|eukprot:KPI87634.1 hypothetical protein ABL78_3291 [Leptomonas seymouri]
MSTADLHIDFVLVRGPASLDRRLHVRLPRNGTPITVGRAPHCTMLLDPLLLFSSQVQCSLFAMPVKASSFPLPPAVPTTPAHPPPADGLNADETPGSAAAADPTSGACTPAHQTARGQRDSTRDHASFKVYITDMCSSNGTFVNGLRISGTDPTELQQGDVCIFGGMRDIEVGEALPADAYAGPELVLWRVDMGLPKDSSTHDFDFTATPLVLPAKAVLAAEVSALVGTAQRSLSKPQKQPAETGFSVTPAAQRPLNLTAATATTEIATPTVDAAACSRDEKSQECRGDSPHGVPQQLFTSPAPRAVEEGEDAVVGVRDTETLAPVAAARNTEDGEGISDVADRRSASLVAAAQEADDDTPAPAGPPTALRYTAVRVGNVTFAAVASTTEQSSDKGVIDALSDGQVAKRARTEADPEALTASSKSTAKLSEALPLLTCTDTHVKWVMPSPNVLLKRQQQQQRQREQEYAQDKTSSSKGCPEDRLVFVQQTHTKPFYGMLAVTSLLTVLACVERRGIAVELKDGCQLPLVDEAVLSGPAESRWVVWMLAPDMAAAAVGVADHSHSNGSHSSTALKRRATGRGCRKAAAAKIAESEEEMKGGAQTQEGVEAALETPEERFEAWLKHFQLFYRGQRVPRPHLVDAATFDLIFAPPLSPLTKGE